MYGTNWAGSTLRHDWLAYLGLGACALKRERYALGGALLGAAAMIRAFPALAVFGRHLPGAVAAGRALAAHHRLPPLRAVPGAEPGHRPHRRWGRPARWLALFAFSAVSPARPSPGCDWLHKVAQLSSDPHPSHISLRSLVAGWEGNQHAVLRQRLPVFIAGIAVFPRPWWWSPPGPNAPIRRPCWRCR